MKKWLTALTLAGSVALSGQASAELAWFDLYDEYDEMVTYDQETGSAMIKLSLTAGMTMTDVQDMLANDAALSGFYVATNDEMMSILTKENRFQNYVGYSPEREDGYYDITYNVGVNTFTNPTPLEFEVAVDGWLYKIFDPYSDYADDMQEHYTYGISVDESGNFYRTGIHYDPRIIQEELPVLTYYVLDSVPVTNLGNEYESVFLYNANYENVPEWYSASPEEEPPYEEMPTEQAGANNVPGPWGVGLGAMSLFFAGAMRRKK